MSALPSVRSLFGRIGLVALLGFPAAASAHTIQICWQDVGATTTFYAGTYHSPYEAPSPVGGIILDGFEYPFSGWISPSGLPAGAHCYSPSNNGYGWSNPVGNPDGVAHPYVVHFQTFTSSFAFTSHTINFTSTNQVQSPLGTYPAQLFGGGACADADFDGQCNGDDVCPLDTANDGDDDGICANEDNCPLDSNASQIDANYNGTGDACEGVVCGNGLVTGSEECDDSNIAGGDGCSAICTLEISDPDSDGDGVPDSVDMCEGDDSFGDTDDDGVCDDEDICQGDDSSGDTDADGVCDTSDNCPSDANALQADDDADGTGNVCEADSDNDSVIDDLDNCPFDFNADQADNDGDTDGDVCDSDDDDDGADDVIDNCPVLYNADQSDYDGDNVGDVCDGDDDGDLVLDEDDICPATPAGVYYDSEGCSGTQRVELECDADGVWANHGDYVSCVVSVANDAYASGLLTNKESAAIKRAAAQGSVGH